MDLMGDSATFLNHGVTMPSFQVSIEELKKPGYQPTGPFGETRLGEKACWLCTGKLGGSLYARS